MAIFNTNIVKLLKAQSEAITGIMSVMYEMALILIKIEPNDTIFEFIEEYQKTIKGGIKDELD